MAGKLQPLPPMTPEEEAAAKKPLSPKLQAFVQHYLADPQLNAKAAYIKAGFSVKTAEQASSMAMRMPNVRAAIDREMKKRAEKMEITQEMVLAEIAKIAFLDPRRFFNENGELIAIHNLPADAAAALSGFDIVTVQKGEGAVEYVAKIKMSDKLRALELAGKHVGMWKEKVEHSGPDGGPIPIAAMPTDPIEAAKAYQRLINGDG